MALPGYRSLWIVGAAWHAARWIAVFGTAYRVNAETADPLLVQLVGTAFMIPMFLGGPVAGTITDRFDRFRTIGRYLLFLMPVSGLMGLAVTTGTTPVLVSYGFVALVGVGNVVDMTSRRSLAFQLAGPTLLTNAAALESIALQGGSMVGNLLGGAILQTLDSAAVYLGLAVWYLASWAFFTVSSHRIRPTLHEPGPSSGEPASGRSLRDDLGTGFGILRTNPVLRQFLVTTVLMNFFFYAFMPLIPYFADELGVGAFLAGLLGAAVGMGTMIGAMVVARWQPARRGLVHLIGSAGAMTMLLVFANMTWYPAAFGALFLAGLVGSGFGTTQSALVVSLVDDSLRGRALGAMSMAIGALPFGMLALGLVAQRTDPRTALNLSVVTGLVLLFVWQYARPHLRRL